MTITIITATYNSELTVKKTIDSILNQTIKDFEYIIIDGNSDDGTAQIIKDNEYRFKNSNITFKWVSEPDKGIYDAWNKGINLATGNWISFLGSDDYYTDKALEVYRDVILNKSNNIDLIYSNVDLIYKEKTIKKINGTWKWSVFRRYMNIAHVGAFHNRAYFDRYGLFNVDYKIAGDYELLLRAKEELKAFKIDFISAYMNDGGISNNNVNLAFRETMKAKINTARVPYLLCLYDFMLASIKYRIKIILKWVK